jgi:DNA (cytosine-5)-methyltransferase 1
MAALWPTPNASDGDKGPVKFARGNPSLGHAAKTWPLASTNSTPKARDGRDSLAPSGMRRNSPDLGVQAAFHSSRRDQENMTPGGESLKSTRRLNPLFVEWLIGWPIGWTDCDSAVTGFSLWLQRSRSALFTGDWLMEKGA